MHADKNGLRAEVREMLKKAGWEARGKVRLEASSPSVADLLQAVERATQILQREPKKPGEGTLDHLWIFVEGS